MEKPDVLIFRKQEKRSYDNAYRVRITTEAYDTVDMIAKATNMTQNEIATKMIMYAAKHYTIKGE